MRAMKETRAETAGPLHLWELKEGVTYSAFVEGRKISKKFRLVEGVLMNNGYNGQFGTVCEYVPMEATFAIDTSEIVGKSVSIMGIKEGYVYTGYQFDRPFVRRGGKLFDQESNEELPTKNLALRAEYECKGVA